MKQNLKFKGVRLCAFYVTYRLMRALGLGITPEKAVSQPIAVRNAMRAPGWATLAPPADVRTEYETIPGRAGPIAIKKYFPAKLNPDRSEEHTSELQSLMRTSYAVFCLKKKKKNTKKI